MEDHVTPPQHPVSRISDFRSDEAFAHALDAADPLRAYRDRFHMPRRRDGRPVIYLCGNSLGLQPKATRQRVERELTDWAELAVDAHFEGATPWFPYHEVCREPAARLVGGLPHEVVVMNSLTVNLHLLMVTFYRPTRERHRIVIEHPAFPSDIYAAQTQLRHHGYDPADGLIQLGPRPGEHVIRPEAFEELFEERGDEVALVLLGGVNYFTGQCFDMPGIVAAGHRAGCVVGLDLAHAAGNVPLQLHDWDVDFAAWCSYKYLNSGPGAVAGCFIHERHARNTDLHRFGGWWGNDPDRRFRMHLEERFAPVPSADAWQLSNPPILALAPVKTSLDIFDEATMPALRAKSEKLTGYLEYLLRERAEGTCEVITPLEPAQRGCQLSILAKDDPRRLFSALQDRGVVCDFREPDIIRVAPVPLYNSFHDVWEFVNVLSAR